MPSEYDITNISSILPPNSHLLLGNGFSIHLLNKNFSYEQLKKESDFSVLNATDINCIFDAYETYDFEFVMKKLVEAKRVFQAYGYKSYQLDSDKDKLRDLLVDAVSRNHPDGYTTGGLDKDQIERFNKEIKRFENIFTLNYDLLLYWLVMEDTNSVSDGFSRWVRDYLCFRDDSKFNINYIHGGLHIFDGILEDEYEIIKLRKKDDNTLSDTIKDFIRNNWYPVTVSEGDYRGKIKLINQNTYLRKCFRKFKNLSGNLFVFGCSFNQDDHILNAIAQSNISKVFVAVRGLNEDNTKAKDMHNMMYTKIKNRLDGKLYFFDSSELFIK